ncbi:MAG: dTDP-4-dehydrorhamnose 3,5-epimerase family protein [Treponema sp.]|jgi:dTDP-4-dehydrorhamnose 3,5-epimerase|nr:dTDP-4-dehydrorhamnose 3,5-epimerase family protein [Treponema sp.]
MGQFTFEKTTIEGVLLFRAFGSFDERGGLVKDYSRYEFTACGIRFEPTESYFLKRRKGTISANRMQVKNPQIRLFSVLEGTVFNAITDLRPDSPTYKRWEGFRLSVGMCLLVPKGCSNGSLYVRDSLVSVKSEGIYDPSAPNGFLWNDKTIGIQYPIDEIGGIERLIISQKDGDLPAFEDIEPYLDTSGGL